MALDAKYKGYEDWQKVQNPDLYQVVTYMHILGMNKGGFIVPSKDEITVKPRTLNGFGGQMSIIGMNVDQRCLTYGDYMSMMEIEELRLQEFISDSL